MLRCRRCFAASLSRQVAVLMRLYSDSNITTTTLPLEEQQTGELVDISEDDDAQPKALSSPLTKFLRPTAQLQKPASDLCAASLGGRLWKSYESGNDCRVHLDSNMFVWVVLDTKNSSRNVLSESMVESLEKAFDICDTLVSRQKAFVVVVTSAKRDFCLGLDMQELLALNTKEEAIEFAQKRQKLFTRIEESKYPVVCAIQGNVEGCGAELALSCHHRLIASDGSRLRFVQGLLSPLPGCGGCTRLQKLCGVRAASRWMFAPHYRFPTRCKIDHLVDAVIGSAARYEGEERFLSNVRKWCGHCFDRPMLPAKPKSKTIGTWLLENNPLGRSLLRRQLRRTLSERCVERRVGLGPALEVIQQAARAKDIHSMMQLEAEAFAETVLTPQMRNMCRLQSASEKIVEHIDATTPLSIGIAPAEAIGRGVSLSFAWLGRPVSVYTRTTNEHSEIQKWVGEKLSKAVQERELTRRQMVNNMSKMKWTIDPHDLKGHDVIIETVPENEKIKLLQLLEAHGVLNEKTVVASSTLATSISELQKNGRFPQNIVGTRVFSPVGQLRLVEIAKGSETSKETVATVCRLARQWRKKPIIVNDSPGSLVFRLLSIYAAEALKIVSVDGCNPIRVETAMVAFGMPVGPLRLLDEFGLANYREVTKKLELHFGPRFALPEAVDRLISDGYGGGKEKRKGIYRYDENGVSHGLNASLAEKYFSSATNSVFPISEIVMRCAMLFVNEAARALEEGVAEGAQDVDLATVWGAGFPAFRGGVLRYADQKGLREVVARLQELEKEYGERFAPCNLLVEKSKRNESFFPC